MTPAIEEARYFAAPIFDAYGAPNYATLCRQNSRLVDNLIVVKTLLAAIELGERREREAQVAWLREVAAHRNPLRMVQGDPVGAILDEVRCAIERGDHHA